MLSVIDAPEMVEYKDYALAEERLPTHSTHPRLWYTMVEYVRRHRGHISHATRPSCQRLLHPIEMPLERMARENPMLFLRVFTGL